MSIRRKNLNIDQEKLDRAKKVLGAGTETEAVDLALDQVLFVEEMGTGLTALAELSIDPVFATEDERRELEGC
jgi:Bacterial antitoxin of type II TA system, VapB